MDTADSVKTKHGIARKLILYIICFSLLITLIMTSLQLYFDYSRDVQLITDRMEQIKTSYLQSIITDLWVANESLLKVQLEGVLQLPDMQYLEIQSNEGPIISLGTPQSENVIKREFPLIYNYRNKDVYLGTLHVVASLDGVYQRMIDKSFMHLVTHAVEIFLVSMFIFFLFYFLVGRHLNVMADYAASFDLKHLDKALSLKRPGRTDKNVQDELDKLVNAINIMRTNLSQDIVNQKQAEESLKKEMGFTEKAIDAQMDTFFVFDAGTGKAIRWNKRFREISGYSDEEIYNLKAPDSYYSEEDLKKAASSLTKLMQRGTGQVEMSLICKDGKKVQTEYSASTINDEEGNPSYIISIGRDITARNKAESRLKASEEKFSRVFYTSPDSITVTSLEEGTIVDINEGFEKLFGYRRDEVIGKTTVEIDLWANAEDRAKMVDMLEKEGHLRDYEVTLRNKSGETRSVSLSIEIVELGGKPHSVAIARDITDRKLAEEEKKKLEDQLIQTQKMESIGTLAGGIAHDFNNILNAILGFTYLAKMKIPEDSDAVAKLDSLTQAVGRAADLVKQILIFSRSSTEELKPTLVTPVLKEALKLLRASIPSTIEMRENISPTGHILADPVQIHQILMNLCTNAYHAMQETGGILGVDLQVVNITPDFASLYLHLAPGPYVRLTVSDTGSGIDNSIIDKIFEPYFTTKEKGKGTGLGLSVVHGIVKNCGGEITVTSSPSEGTTFQVYFPLIQQETPQAEKADETLPNGTGTVLFVDDEKASVLISTEILESLGYNVIGKTDCLEALGLFKEDPDKFDVVITDMTMPKMTGIKLAQEMIGIRPDIPVILCTGFSEGINEEMVKQKGIREFLMKPVAPVKMAKAIHTVLERNGSAPGGKAS